MKAILFISFCLSLTFSLIAQDSVSVLFIGNSYTSVNDLPAITNNITTSLGDKITFNSQTIGGATFATHSANSVTYQKIHSNPWDFVVLQGQSQELSFPTVQVNTESLPYIEQLADSIHESKYCSQILLYMTWGRQNGDPQWDSISTFDKMNGRLANAAVRMADSIEASVSPVAIAWKNIRDNYPGINLYSSDGSHPSFEGSYLAACTFYASLFRKSPVGATYLGTLDPNTAIILQNAAALTVLDSLDRWHLHALGEQTIAQFAYLENATEVNFYNTSSHATSYHWDFGDGQNSTEVNPIHHYSANGTYNIRLIAIDSCDTDTLNMQITCNNAGMPEPVNNHFLVKNLNNDLYLIENTLNEEYQLSIIDITGKVIRSKSSFETKHIIDLSQHLKNMYFIRLENKMHSHTIKIIKN